MMLRVKVWRQDGREQKGRFEEFSPAGRLVVTTNGEKSAEAIIADQSVKGRINRSLKYDQERRAGLEHRKQGRKLPAKG